MAESNPYQTPKANVVKESKMDPALKSRMDNMASGQKLVIYAMLIYLATIVVRAAIGPMAAGLLIISLIMSLIGVYRILAGGNDHIVIKIILFFLLVVPVVNLLVLLRVNANATKTLREAGYTVGFLGAKYKA